MTVCISTIIGNLYISANESFITEITLEKRDITETNPLLESAKRQLDEYFKGLRKSFDLPLDLSNLTCFGKKVLEQCSKIPYGRTPT